MLYKLVSLSLCMFAVIGPVEGLSCPQQNKSAELRFTTELGYKDYVRINKGIAIPCCAEGYVNITWYKDVNGTWQLFPVTSSSDTIFYDNGPEVLHDGQVLQFYDTKVSDAGTYRCYVAGVSKFILHDTQIIVEECDKLPRGPYMVDPVPENQTIYNYGGNVTFHCTGYFGCTEKGDAHLVLWKVEGSKKLITNISTRYLITNERDDRPDKLTLGSTLTITSVSEEDVDRTFICNLVTPQMYDGQTYKKVRIFKKDKPQSPLARGLIIGGCSFVVVMIIIYLSRCLYGPQIKLFCSSRLHCCGLKAIDNEAYSYNLFIYHAEEDETKAQDIKDYLTSDKEYKVFIAADIEGNENVMHKVFEKIEHSALVVFLYSKNLREDDLANFFLQSMIRSRKGKDILILEVETYKPKQMHQWQEKHAENMRVLRERYNNEINGEIEVATDVREEMSDDLQFWKILPRLKVPNLNQKGRKRNYFWCALQNKIPKFDYQKQKKGKKQQNEQRHSSSDRPLLNSTRESETLTPQMITHNTDEFSPCSNEVFTFEDPNMVVQTMPYANHENNSRNLITFEQETNLSEHDENSENSSTDMRINDNDVRSRFSRDKFDYSINSADVHHNQGKTSPDTNNIGNNGQKIIEKNISNNIENSIESIENGDEENSDNTTSLESKQDIFSMSGEKFNSSSFDSESGGSGENASCMGLGNKSSRETGNDHNGILLSQSSGFSDFNSERSLSPCQMPINLLENNPYLGSTNHKKEKGHSDTSTYAESNTEAGKHNNRTPLELSSHRHRNDSLSSSPESGYNTSPDRILSGESYLPQIVENIER